MNRLRALGVAAITTLGLPPIPDGVIAQQMTMVAPEVRQALAPSGKLRVGVYPDSPFSMVRDRVSGEMKGIAVELGKALAMRLDIRADRIPQACGNL